MLPTGTFNENLPSISVIVPVVVPFTDTLAPIIVSPVASLTTPEIVRELCWATASPSFEANPFSAFAEPADCYTRSTRPAPQFPILKAFPLFFVFDFKFINLV